MNIDRKTKDEKEDSWQHHITDSDLSLKLFTVKQYTSDEEENNKFNRYIFMTLLVISLDISRPYPRNVLLELLNPSHSYSFLYYYVTWLILMLST